jgi:hypothetical protein
MFLRKVWLALYHFRWTFVFLVIAGIVSVHFEINTLGAFILAAFMGWLQAFVDKVREIGHQLELERAAEPGDHELRTNLREDVALTRHHRRARGILIDWQAIFFRAKKTFIGLAIVLGLLAAITLVYLYLYF